MYLGFGSTTNTGWAHTSNDIYSEHRQFCVSGGARAPDRRRSNTFRCGPDHHVAAFGSLSVGRLHLAQRFAARGCRTAVCKGNSKGGFCWQTELRRNRGFDGRLFPRWWPSRLAWLCERRCIAGVDVPRSARGGVPSGVELNAPTVLERADRGGTGRPVLRGVAGRLGAFMHRGSRRSLMHRHGASGKQLSFLQQGGLRPVGVGDLTTTHTDPSHLDQLNPGRLLRCCIFGSSLEQYFHSPPSLRKYWVTGNV